ncbi:SEC-C domain-containing protein [Asanoa sp. NPDC049475]
MLRSYSPDQLVRLYNLLQRSSDLSGAVEEEYPELAAQVRDRSTRRADVQFYVGLIIAILSLLIGPYWTSVATGDPPSSEEIAREVVEQLQEQAPSTGASPSAPAPNSSSSGVPSPKTGRNEPCPCGSGLKFKRCHARPGP